MENMLSGANITVIDWISWSVAIAVTIYIIFAKNPYGKGTRKYRALRLCRISLALLAWSFGFGLVSFAFASVAFILATMGIMRGRTGYGFVLLIGCVCAPVLSLSGDFLGFTGAEFHDEHIAGRENISQAGMQIPVVYRQDIVRQKIPVPDQTKATPPDKFEDAIDDLYWKLVSLFLEGRVEEAAQILDLFKAHDRLDYKDVRDFYTETRIDDLEKKVKRISPGRV